MGGNCILGLNWDKELPRIPTKVIIGAAGTNGLIRGHLSDWVFGGGVRGVAAAWLQEANPVTHPKCHEHVLWDNLPCGGKR